MALYGMANLEQFSISVVNCYFFLTLSQDLPLQRFP
jgi:hypothetical protein